MLTVNIAKALTPALTTMNGWFSKGSGSGFKYLGMIVGLGVGLKILNTLTFGLIPTIGRLFLKLFPLGDTFKKIGGFVKVLKPILSGIGWCFLIFGRTIMTGFAAITPGGWVAIAIVALVYWLHVGL